MNEMLGKVVRVLVTVKAEWLGALADLMEKLTSPDGDSWFKNLKLFLRKEPCQWEVERPAEPKPINIVIRVDRTIKPTYPDWMTKVIHPELEAQGPAEYDLTNVEQWLHDGQKNGKWIEGNKIYAKLQENDNAMLKTCLTLRDGEEIKRNGIETYCKFFKGKALFLWGSVVQRGVGSLYVPFLDDDRGKVVVHWVGLDYGWDGHNPAGRLAS